MASMSARVPALNAGLVAALVMLATTGPANAAGGFVITYQPPPPAIRPLADALREGGVLEDALGLVNATLTLPGDVPVVFDTCGEPNAFYLPDSRRIVFCYEFVAFFAGAFANEAHLSADEYGEVIIGTTLFILMHEVGHALVHVLELPITGREEDAVDDLAALILMQADAHRDVLAAAWNFALLADTMQASGAELRFWIEHSLNAQRAFAMTCMVFGSNPEEFADLVGQDLLPAQRAARCAYEFERKSAAWNLLLEAHFTPGI